MRLTLKLPRYNKRNSKYFKTSSLFFETSRNHPGWIKLRLPDRISYINAQDVKAAISELKEKKDELKK